LAEFFRRKYICFAESCQDQQAKLGMAPATIVSTSNVSSSGSGGGDGRIPDGDDFTILETISLLQGIDDFRDTRNQGYNPQEIIRHNYAALKLIYH